MPSFKVCASNPLTACVLNRDSSLVATVGRNVFKIFTIEEKKFSERINLRIGKVNLNFSSCDISWNPCDENYLATAATNGSVVIWNLLKSSHNKQDYIFPVHIRSVNRVNFHPNELSLILTASQDGTIKCLDMRQFKVAQTFYSNSEGVLDVQFNGFYTHLFASAQENGTVQLWDIRYPKSCEREFSAHSGPVFTCEWHKSMKKCIATAGRDKTLKIWNVHSMPQCDFSISSFSSISRIKWRPSFDNQISSISLVNDYNLSLWDLRSPFMPFALLSNHTDIPTGLDWGANSSFCVSCGKDGFLSFNNLLDYSSSTEHSRKVSIAFNPTFGQLISCVNQKKLSSSLKYEKPSLSSNLLSAAYSQIHQSSTSKVPKLFHKSISYIYDQNFDACFKENPSFFAVLKSFRLKFEHDSLNMESIVTSAKSYKFFEGSVFDNCLHNAGVSLSMQRPLVAQAWKILHLLLMYNNLKPTMQDTSTDKTDCIYSARTLKKSSLGNDATVEKKSLTLGNAEFQVASSHNNEGRMECAERENRNSNTDCQYERATIKVAKVLASSPRIYPILSCSEKASTTNNYSSPLYCQHNINSQTSLPVEAFDAPEYSNSLYIQPSFENFTALFSHLNIAHAFNSESVPKVNYREKNPSFPSTSPLFIKECAKDVLFLPSFNFTETITSIIRYYAENQNDVQTAIVMLVIVANNAGAYPNISSSILEYWFTSYIEILRRYKLFVEANEIILACKLDSVHSLNQASTLFNTCCSKCQRSLTGPYCNFCSKFATLCSICKNPVKGLYTSCQTCNHGGHVLHLKSWFNSNTFCPTGCGHKCQSR